MWVEIFIMDNSLITSGIFRKTHNDLMIIIIVMRRQKRTLAIRTGIWKSACSYYCHCLADSWCHWLVLCLLCDCMLSCLPALNREQVQFSIAAEHMVSVTWLLSCFRGYVQQDMEGPQNIHKQENAANGKGWLIRIKASFCGLTNLLRHARDKCTAELFMFTDAKSNSVAVYLSFFTCRTAALLLAGIS